MIEQIVDNFQPTSAPFLYEQIDSVLISDNPIVLDLFFLEEFNGLVLKDFTAFSEGQISVQQSYVEIENKRDLEKLKDFKLNDKFAALLEELLEGLNTTLVGIQITEPIKEMCPSYHVDKLPLRLVQCLDGEGTTLMTDQGRVIHTGQNDLILLKGEMWQSKVGALKHRSPISNDFRRLLRVDFLD